MRADGRVHCGVWDTGSMLRWMTAGESHGPALIATIEGLPSGLHVTTEDLRRGLARRRLGYGRGARQKFEATRFRFSLASVTG